MTASRKMTKISSTIPFAAPNIYQTNRTIQIQKARQVSPLRWTVRHSWVTSQRLAQVSSIAVLNDILEACKLYRLIRPGGGRPRRREPPPCGRPPAQVSQAPPIHWASRPQRVSSGSQAYRYAILDLSWPRGSRKERSREADRRCMARCVNYSHGHHACKTLGMVEPVKP